MDLDFLKSQAKERNIVRMDKAQANKLFADGDCYGLFVGSSYFFAKVFNQRKLYASMSVEHFLSECWIATHNAFKQYDPSRGPWMQMLSWQIKSQLRMEMRLGREIWIPQQFDMVKEVHATVACVGGDVIDPKTEMSVFDTLKSEMTLDTSNKLRKMLDGYPITIRYFLDGYTLREIATELGYTHEGVRKRLNKEIESLKQNKKVNWELK